MKTLRHILFSFLLPVMGLAMLTSCDEDMLIGDTLTRVEGRWFGDMDMYINGQKSRGSDIQFTARNLSGTRGWGVEYDYYGRYGSYTIRHDFDWEIREGIIYLTFDDPDLDCAIRSYSLNNRHFSGWLDGYDSSTYFDLYSYEYYWDDYGYADYDYDYYWYDNYYVKGQNGLAPKDTTIHCTRGVNIKKEESPTP